MADLRERLETYTNAFGPDEAAYFSEAAWAQLHETLREVLAHPEKLMGEPVKWMDVDGDTVSAEYYAGADDRTKEWYKIPLYAPEVKP